jgi:hypothetical membrane protein
MATTSEVPPPPGPARSKAIDRPPPRAFVRLAALGGVAGPVAFLVACTVASMSAPRYSSSNDAISELAAVGAHSRALMTGGFIALGLCALPYAMALRTALGGRAWITAAQTGLALLLVAAIPLGRSTATDHFHGIAALVGYATLAVTPLLAIRPLVVRGYRGVACLGIATATTSATTLILSDTTSLTGLFQRIGLSAGLGWVAGSSLAMACGRLPTRSIAVIDI